MLLICLPIGLHILPSLGSIDDLDNSPAHIHRHTEGQEQKGHILSKKVGDLSSRVRRSSLGSEDSVETREEGSSRRSSIGKDDRYSQRYQLLMRIQRDS